MGQGVQAKHELEVSLTLEYCPCEQSLHTVFPVVLLILSISPKYGLPYVQFLFNCVGARQLNRLLQQTTLALLHLEMFL